VTLEEVNDLPSRPFKGFDWSVHAHVSHLIDEIFDEYEVWYRGTGTGKRLRDPDKIKQHLTHFVLEPYRSYRAMPDLTMGVNLGKGYYNESGDRYHPKHLSYRVVINVTDFLVAADYLEMPTGKGEWHSDPRLRRTTRFRATQRLIDHCDEHCINPYMIVPYEDPEVIILRAMKKRRGSSGELVEYKDTPFTRGARKNLRKINKYITAHQINLDIMDEQERELLLRLRKRDDPAEDKFLDFTKARLSRIFNNASFEQGGRFYGGWWQQIPGDYRVHITINGKRTVQLDFSGMHFAIMYADMGMDLPMDDPYSLDGYGGHLRVHIKKAFNIIINCASRKAAIGTIDGRIENGELSGELGSGDRLIQAFAETHPLIKHKIASGEGIRGQFMDSQVAEKVLLKGIDIDRCILPIHDGFITTAGDEFVLEGLMNEAFSEITRHNAKIKPEAFDLSVLPDAGNVKPYWVTRSDGYVERDDPLEGKATSFSRAVSGSALWGMVAKDTEKKKNKNARDKEWKAVHGQ
jgi:hypothetical protein